MGQGDGAQAATSPPVRAGQKVVAATPVEAPPPAQDRSADEGKMTSGEVDGVRLADAPKCDVYVCFEGLLGAHLKWEVHDRIFKGLYW